MGKLSKELIKYLEVTPREQLEKNFKELESWTKIGPSAEDFYKWASKQHKNDNNILIIDHFSKLK